MNLAAYAFAGTLPPLVWISCPFCGEQIYTPESPWIKKEIETLGCGGCEQSIKGNERFEAIGRINDEDLSGYIPPKD